MEKQDANNPQGKVVPTGDRGWNLIDELMGFEIPFLDQPEIRGTMYRRYNTCHVLPGRTVAGEIKCK